MSEQRNFTLEQVLEKFTAGPDTGVLLMVVPGLIRSGWLGSGES